MGFEKTSNALQGRTRPSVFLLRVTNPKGIEGWRREEGEIRVALATFPVLASGCQKSPEAVDRQNCFGEKAFR